MIISLPRCVCDVQLNIHWKSGDVVGLRIVACDDGWIMYVVNNFKCILKELYHGVRFNSTDFQQIGLRGVSKAKTNY